MQPIAEGGSPLFDTLVFTMQDNFKSYYKGHATSTVNSAFLGLVDVLKSCHKILYGNYLCPDVLLLHYIDFHA